MKFPGFHRTEEVTTEQKRPSSSDLSAYAEQKHAPVAENNIDNENVEVEISGPSIDKASTDSKKIKSKTSSNRLTKENADHTPVPLSAKIPAYVRKQLRTRAAREGVTITHLILTALAEHHKITVYADDLMEDRRAKK
jgi:hypothetical protein